MKSALKLIAHVWANNKTTAWEALNHCMFDAVQLAIGAKLEWQPSDFAHIESNFRPGYWLGEHGWERPYALAVWTDGTSFIKAFEAFSKRKPFIANQVSAQGQAEGYAHAQSQNRQRGRIALGSEVWIGDLRYSCTSITNERIILTSRPESGKRSIKKLSQADCAALWPAPKKTKPETTKDENHSHT
jgi:hypothetical protein